MAVPHPTQHAAERHIERVKTHPPVRVVGIAIPYRVAFARWPSLLYAPNRLNTKERPRLVADGTVLWVVRGNRAVTCIPLDENDRAAVLVGAMTGVFPFAKRSL